MKIRTGIHEGELKLLPCPFCGGLPEVESNYYRGRYYEVVCQKCLGKGGPRTRKVNSIRAWNRRADNNE